MNNYNPLTAIGIPMEEVRRYEVAQDGDAVVVTAQIAPTQRACPLCGCLGAKIKEYKSRTLRDLRTQGRKTVVELRLPRYSCPSCGRTYTHSLPIEAEGCLTPQSIESMLRDFRKTLTFSEIAERHDVTVNTAISVFDEKAPNLRQPIGAGLCIDEYSNTRGSFEKYSCILVDFETRKVVDIIKSRTKEYLREYFSSQPKSQLSSVKFVITDMFDGYISAAREFMPQATIAIDPFHWMEYLTEAVQDIRRDLMEACPILLDAAWMGRHWRTLTCAPETLPEGTMTLKTGMTITWRQRIERFVKQDADLAYAYFLLQDFYRTSRKWDKASRKYDWIPYERAKAVISRTITNLKNHGNKRLLDCGKTWEHYQEYIENSFMCIDGRRLSNGPVEGVNSRVKTMKKLYCGYRDKKRFAERVILIVNSRDD